MSKKQFIIDIEEIKKNDLTIKEALYLICLFFDEYFECSECLCSTNKKCLTSYWGKDETSVTKVELTRKGYELVETLFLDSEIKNTSEKGNRLINLAKQLQEIYPEGKKEGTNYYWRDSVNVIAKKLKTIIKKYGDCFTDEQAIEATKKYVNSFGNNTQYMQLLKYFICKNVIKGGEVEETSQMLSYIENMNQSDAQQRIDWENELR